MKPSRSSGLVLQSAEMIGWRVCCPAQQTRLRSSHQQYKTWETCTWFWSLEPMNLNFVSLECRAVLSETSIRRLLPPISQEEIFIKSSIWQHKYVKVSLKSSEEFRPHSDLGSALNLPPRPTRWLHWYRVFPSITPTQICCWEHSWSYLSTYNTDDGMNYVRPEICSTSRTKFL